MTTYRIKYKGIVSELYTPKEHNGKTVVFLPGLPMTPSLKGSVLMQSLIDEGCVVFYPFYSGSYDSEGYFSYKNCVKDVETIIEMANKPNHVELYFQAPISLKTKSLAFVASSFGASVVLNSLVLDKLDSLVLVSPVIEYNQEIISSVDLTFDFYSQMEALSNLLEKAYPYTYRVENRTELLDYLHGKNKVGDIKETLNETNTKTLIIHGEKDTSVYTSITKYFQSLVKNTNIFWRYPEKGGHSISSYDEATVGEIKDFIMN